MDYTAVGKTTHLAARMEQLAHPGSILMTGETLRQVMGYVAVRSLGLVSVKGLHDPVEAFELQGAGPARTRMQAMTMRGRTRFVGRETECARAPPGVDPGAKRPRSSRRGDGRAGGGQVPAHP